MNWMNGPGQRSLLPHPPLMPPQFLLPEMMNINPAPAASGPLIGPILPDNMTTEDMTISDDETGPTDKNKHESNRQEQDKDRSKERERDSRRDSRDNRDRDRSRSDRRSDRVGRNDGGRNDSNRSEGDRNNSWSNRDRYDKNRFDDRNKDRNRNRRTKWSDNDDSGPMMPGLVNQNQTDQVIMPGMENQNQGMPGIGNQNQGMMPGMRNQSKGNQGMMPGMQGMMSGMPGMGQRQGLLPLPDSGLGTQGMMGNSQGMGTNDSMNTAMPGMMGQFGMQNMPNSGMSNMTMMPGMNNMMMENMLNQNNMMMMNQQMMPNQSIYIGDVVLLPPVPGTTTPTRREKPNGCRTIFVGGLPRSITEDIISDMFQNFGNISDIKVHPQGVCHVRFDKHESVEASFFLSGYRFKTSDQTDNEATTLFVDYALNREDQNEFERSKRLRQKTPPRIEPFNFNTLNTIGEKIKSDEQFIEAAPTLICWLERGECNKRNASNFYSLVQASNNQVRRLFNEKLALEDEYQGFKSTLRDKFAKVIGQFEQVAKILAVAKHQRVSDHFTKQQRRNIDMWLKMTEEVENMKEEFNAIFDDEEMEKCGRNVVPAEKYEQLRTEHETLMFELEGYKNEVFLAKDEAERKFEKFKAHFVAQQALQNKHGQVHIYPPLPSPPPLPNLAAITPITKPQPPPPTPDDLKMMRETAQPISTSEAKLISLITAFLMVHPLGASVDYILSYIRSMVPDVTPTMVQQLLQKYPEVFTLKSSGIGANLEHRWSFVTFDIIKKEVQ